MRLFRSLCALVLAILAAGSAGATSCAGNSSFLESVKWYRDHGRQGRIVRARVVPTDTDASLPAPDPYLFKFEILEFFTAGKRDEIGTRLQGGGWVVGYLLNLPPTGHTALLPKGSEWILQVWGEGPSMRSDMCSSILEVRGDTVHGLIQNPAGTPPGWRSRALAEADNKDASQSMPLADFRRALDKLNGSRKTR
ncbi:hypothetical protein [Variovorax sp. EL159]|uniref:hypothetical protein n=1 Tax=Variovorax sp. EL159 TaxID=1566270 RepID=UPI00087E11A0|nr:hypothetical protein [Variovorax sp. EL159]SCX43431.1 hypothetical protein SAMN03159363_0655 [Variovorax sp. EL159]